MKKLLPPIFILLCLLSVNAQQLPYYTQFRLNQFLMNPGVTGTKKTIDARIGYRKQWVGFDGAPVSQYITAHSRLYNGTMGVGASFYKDVTGPTERQVYTLSYAYHLRFPDLEMSIGASGLMTKYFLNTGTMTLHNSHDVAIDVNRSDRDMKSNANVGLYIYNDRFHLGLSVLNVLDVRERFYQDDPKMKSMVKLSPHIYGSAGYVFSNSKRYIWENSIMVNYVTGAPFFLDYTVRLLFNQKVFGGLNVRPGDALAVSAGFIFNESVHFCYSYDFVISPLRAYSSGSHEITLAYMMDLAGRNNDKRLKRFLKQKYSHML